MAWRVTTAFRVPVELTGAITEAEADFRKIGVDGTDMKRGFLEIRTSALHDNNK